MLHLLALTKKTLLVLQVGEVDKGYKGSGDDDHPWLEAGCHKLLKAKKWLATRTTRICEDFCGLIRCEESLEGVRNPFKG